MKTDNNTNEIDIKQLKTIRESKKMTVESLAEKLKITRDFVRYIESGDFAKLGAPTFVKGHVSNYCKVLGISYDEVLSQIPSQFLQVQTLRTPDALGVSPLARVKRKSNHLGRYAVGTALLGMLALSFYFVWDKWNIPVQSPDTNLRLADSNSNNKKNGKNVTYSSLIPQVKLQEKPAENVNDDAAEKPTDDSQIEPDKDLMPVTETIDAMNTDKPSAEVEEPVEQVINELQAQASYSILLQLSEEAWVSIKTDDGNKLEHDLVKAGKYTYQSDQPVHFRIGNAEKARVKINDEVIELSEFMSKNIADFNWPKDPG